MFNLANEYITMVCVKATSENILLIQEGRRIADQTNSKLYVITVQKKSAWGKKFGKELDHLLMISKTLDAEMLVFFSDYPIDILNNCIKKNRIKHILLGQSHNKTFGIAKQLDIDTQKIKLHIGLEHDTN